MEALLTQEYFKGKYYPTYDTKYFSYSWSSNGYYNDRIDSIQVNVTQDDGKTNSHNAVYYTTGWEDHHYSGTFSRYENTLPPATIVACSGMCQVGVEMCALFEGGYTKYITGSVGWGRAQ